MKLPGVYDGEGFAGAVVKIEALHRLQLDAAFLRQGEELAVGGPNRRIGQSFAAVRIRHVHHAGLQIKN